MEALPTFARLNLFRSNTHTAIFIVCILVSAGVLLFYAKRHPHPKFRPKFGELVLVAMIFFGISLGITAMTAGLFNQENLDDGAKKARDRSRSFKDRQRTSSGEETPGGDDDSSSSSSSSSDDELPPFIPSED